MTVIYVAVYITLFPIQVIIQVLFTGPFGLFTAWISVWQQANMISNYIFKTFIFPDIERITFDSILRREGRDDVVQIGRLRRIVRQPFIVKFGRLVASIGTCVFLPVKILRTLTLIAVGSIPIIGPVFAIILIAPTRGFKAHSRYFVLKGYDDRKIRSIYREKTAEYAGFGIVAIVLEGVPLFNILFSFTNIIGGALWAIDLEKTLINKLEARKVPKPIELKQVERVNLKQYK